MQSRGLFLCCRLPWLLRFMDNFGSASHKNLFLVSLWRVHLSLHWKSNKGIWTTLRIWIKCAIFSSPLNLQDSRGIQCVLKTWTLILIIHHLWRLCDKYTFIAVLHELWNKNFKQILWCTWHPMCLSNLDFSWWTQFLSFDIWFQVKSCKILGQFYWDQIRLERSARLILIIDSYPWLWSLNLTLILDYELWSLTLILDFDPLTLILDMTQSTSRHRPKRMAVWNTLCCVFLQSFECWKLKSLTYDFGEMGFSLHSD